MVFSSRVAWPTSSRVDSVSTSGMRAVCNSDGTFGAFLCLSRVCIACIRYVINVEDVVTLSLFDYSHKSGGESGMGLAAQRLDHVKIVVLEANLCKCLVRTKCEESLRLALPCTGIARRSCSWTTTLQQLRTKHARTGLAGARRRQVL